MIHKIKALYDNGNGLSIKNVQQQLSLPVNDNSLNASRAVVTASLIWRETNRLFGRFDSH